MDDKDKCRKVKKNMFFYLVTQKNETKKHDKQDNRTTNVTC